MNRQGRRGGGLALIYSIAIKAKISSAEETFFYEHTVWSFTTKSITGIIIGIYTRPYSKTNPVTVNTFLDEFAEFIGEYVVKWNTIITTGDVNINMLTDSSEKMAFCDTVESFNLVQHVKLPTVISGSLLDLVITKVESSLEIYASTEQNFM